MFYELTTMAAASTSQTDWPISAFATSVLLNLLRVMTATVISKANVTIATLVKCEYYNQLRTLTAYTHANIEIKLLQYDLPSSLICEKIPIKTVKNDRPRELRGVSLL